MDAAVRLPVCVCACASLGGVMCVLLGTILRVTQESHVERHN